ncbi:MAG TPA: SRPBCC family protein [Thermoanaerobaculia bacterium]|nr:SRPBCC family protein [Thermoanaerobaculia bacterium]
MKTFDVQTVELAVPRGRAFELIADPVQLPRWTHAFAFAGSGEALMRTPNGEVRVGLEVEASTERGTIDWRMTFPDGSVASAFSRLVDLAEDRCLFSFVLTPPPVPLELLEGALEAQSRTLAEELVKLKGILEGHA